MKPPLMPWRDWLGCIGAAPSGGFAWALILDAVFRGGSFGFSGLLLLLFALGIRAWVMGLDLDEPGKRD